MDAASGGFVAPFLYPDLQWDFRLPNVLSINASGHKCAPWLLGPLFPLNLLVGRVGVGPLLVACCACR